MEDQCLLAGLNSPFGLQELVRIESVSISRPVWLSIEFNSPFQPISYPSSGGGGRRTVLADDEVRLPLLPLVARDVGVVAIKAAAAGSVPSQLGARQAEGHLGAPEQLAAGSIPLCSCCRSRNNA